MSAVDLYPINEALRLAIIRARRRAGHTTEQAAKVFAVSSSQWALIESQPAKIPVSRLSGILRHYGPRAQREGAFAFSIAQIRVVKGRRLSWLGRIHFRFSTWYQLSALHRKEIANRRLSKFLLILIYLTAIRIILDFILTRMDVSLHFPIPALILASALMPFNRVSGRLKADG